VKVGDERYQTDGSGTGDGFGPYIYSNHFANALAITIPAMCALGLIFTRRHVPVWVAFIGVGLLVAGAAATTGLLAGSRAGTASLMLGGVVFLSLVVETRWLSWMWGGLALVGLAGLLTFVGLFHGPFQLPAELIPDAWEPLVSRIFTDARIDAARIAARMFAASPVLGTGLGSYGELFPRFTGRDTIMYFAHNDVAQLLAEGGLAALLVFAGAVAILIGRFSRFSRERRPGSRTIDAAAWAAIAAGAAHSIFDWNMHAPANAFLACVIVGLAMSSVVPKPATSDSREWTWSSRLLTATLITAVIAALGFLARDAALERPVRRLQEAITAARLAGSPEARADASRRLAAAIAAGESAIPYASGHWRLPMLLGQASLHLADAAGQGQAAAPAASAAAERWFRVASLASPVSRGLPEKTRP
jgi:hypothetical protein